LPLQLGLVVLAAAHRSGDAYDPGQDDQVQEPDHSRNDADTTVPNTPPNRSSPEPLSDTARNTVFSAATMPIPIATTTVECPREKKKAEPERARLVSGPPFAQHLADGVVDRRDVVGVECVPQAQGVGQDRHADPQPL
jgi:hypothetical protein